MPFLYQIASSGGGLRRWELDDKLLIVGRDERATVRIPDNRMSGEHFSVFRKGPAFFLQDLGSTNGTWLNRRRIGCHKLKWNDRIVAGQTSFSFEPGMGTLVHALEQIYK